MEIVSLNISRSTTHIPYAGRTYRPAPVQETGTISVRSHVVLAVREAISSGVLLPGERLSEAKLCQEFGVSRTSIREALRYLEAEKLITILSNRRAMVSKVTASQAETIYQVLAALISEATAERAKSISIKNLNLLRFTYFEIEDSRQLYSAPDMARRLSQFYGLVLELRGDPVITGIAKTLLARVGYLRMLTLSDVDCSEKIFKELYKMIESLSAGNPKVTRDLTVSHIKTEAKAVLDVISSR